MHRPPKAQQQAAPRPRQGQATGSVSWKTFRYSSRARPLHARVGQAALAGASCVHRANPERDKEMLYKTDRSEIYRVLLLVCGGVCLPTPLHDVGYRYRERVPPLDSIPGMMQHAALSPSFGTTEVHDDALPRSLPWSIAEAAGSGGLVESVAQNPHIKKQTQITQKTR